ncbi:MAG TPA: hypothetical protein VKE69_15010, partial [Planctomycetota bacterium]|nr:hypothetical protein [Planctomycetota bacterium]
MIALALASLLQTTAFVDVTVVPMDRERTIAHASAIVRDGRIAWVGAAAEAQIPADAVRID